MHIKFHCVLAFLSVLLWQCTRADKSALFTALTATDSGIDFSNDIEETDSARSFINEFGYMGGGVGIGDFNNDGLKDVFFTGNQVSCRLYLNLGGCHFKDITKEAGISTDAWCTGVSIVDINNDGFDDVYVCTFGKDLLHRSKNLLFINQHNLTFSEDATGYGLADTSYSSQAVFLDYDKDGDLDMFLANYMLNGPNANTIFPKDLSGRSAANDRLYRNAGDSARVGHPVFLDVSMQANIKEDGFGLGVVVSDFNDDTWPDIYVANDFISNDELWLNNKDGTFTNCISRSVQHQSYSSMGADAADINNDGLIDIATLDMLPEFNERKKQSSSFMNYDRYESERSMGYEPEFTRNMLQLNNGVYLDDKKTLPFFSEIGQMAGIAATDWSWSVLMADFNNDGWKDMHITNGIGRDFINADFLEYSNTVFANTNDTKAQQEKIREKLVSLKHINLPNYLYLNNHDYTFTNASHTGGIDEPSMSNGAAYADLDNDGDLDLVVNNINKNAFVWMNHTDSYIGAAKRHFVRIRLTGDSLNRKGFGCKVSVYGDGQVQVQEQEPVRGYFSSVDQDLLFGLGNHSRLDSIRVIWPDDHKELITGIHADTTYTIARSARKVEKWHAIPVNDLGMFCDVTMNTGVVYKHIENSFNDFNQQRLLLQKYSQEGPYLATADINKDGLTDFFVGGAFNFPGQLFVQQKNGKFNPQRLTDSVKMEEDVDCVFFDYDSDGDPDLLVTGGDTRYDPGSVYYQPRLYQNNGGKFVLQKNAFPAGVKTIAGCIATADYDGDGDLDVFIGGRVSARFPLPPASFLLENNHGVFSDVTGKACPGLRSAGMITSAVWTDFDQDQQPDLIVAGEWMPVTFYKNDHGRLKDVTASTGLRHINGMWRSLAVTDIDNDGDPDLVAGNLGSNCIYSADANHPMQLVATDMDGNGSIDPVLFYYIKSENGERRLAPAISRARLAEQVPFIKKRFLYNADFAKASFTDLYDTRARENMAVYGCDETRSCIFENTGNGKFSKHVLPAEAQFAPINAIICNDFDNDGVIDLLVAGNEYQADVITGRYDGSYGCLLRGMGNNRFIAIPATKSGLMIRGDVKDLALIQSRKRKLVIAAVNNDSVRVYSVNSVR